MKTYIELIDGAGIKFTDDYRKLDSSRRGLKINSFVKKHFPGKGWNFDLSRSAMVISEIDDNDEMRECAVLKIVD